jgi:hypothetical protein
MQQRAITIEELSRKLKPLFGKKVDELYFRYSIADTPSEKNEIFQVLSRLYQKHLSQLLDKGILLEPPKEEDVKGEYSLAKVNYAGKELFDFGLREGDWPRHMCVTGMSGSGKTTFGFHILKNFIEKDKPFLVFDWKKSFRPLMGIDKDLMIFTVGNDSVSNLFRVNINKPPKGVNPKEWISTICDLLTESFSASFGVHKIILETLDEAFESWGVYNGSDLYPNWQHIKKLMEQKSRDAKGREMGWYESALRIATILTFGSFGKVVNYDGKRSVSIEDLFDKRAVLELNPLASIEKKFFSEYVLTYIFKLKKAEQNKVDEKFNYAILVDEAHNIFLKKPTNFMSESVTDMIYREMREYGSSLICLDQHVSKLSDTVTGNSACHIAFQQQLPQDIESMSGLMQLKDKKDVFSQVPVGQAIAKISERHTIPFLINVPFMDLRKSNTTDEEVKERMQCIIYAENAKKYDREFLEKIEQPETIEVAEKKANKTEESLNIKEALLKLIAEQKSLGKDLFLIEKMLEENLSEDGYSTDDIIKAISCAMKLELEEFSSKDVDMIFSKLKEISGEEIESIEIYTPKEEVVIQDEEENDNEESQKETILLRSSNGYSGIKKVQDSNEVKIDKISQMEEINIGQEKTEIEKLPETTQENPKSETIEIVESKNDVEKMEQEVHFIEDQDEEIVDIYFPQNTDKELTKEEIQFLKYLHFNKDHTKSTVELYKEVGLSARKGNVVKNKLMEKSLIAIEEERTQKGWKKYIRLTKN